MGQIIPIGMDTSKHIFRLHGVDTAEEPGLRRELRRKDLDSFFFGHEVKLISPQLVKLYVKRGKNDAADAEFESDH